MHLLKVLFPAACLCVALPAQTANDLNGLVAAAGRYVSGGVAGPHAPEALALNKVTGTNGTPEYLMTKSTDVQRWTFLYQLGKSEPGPTFPGPGEPGPAAPGPVSPGGKRHLSAQAECLQGVFKNFHYSDKPVTGTKSLENTWVAVSLDNAILSLNANGYVRGFSKIEVMRPDLANWPDEMVYAFNCPWERRVVAISCQTGALTWSYAY